MMYKKEEMPFCYVNMKNEIILNYKEMKPLITDTKNYNTVLEKITDVFNKVLEVEEKVTVHISLSSLTLIDIDKHYPYLCFIANMFQSNYPDKLEIAYIYDCPFLFSTIYNIVSKILDKKTQEKIKFNC